MITPKLLPQFIVVIGLFLFNSLYSHAQYLFPVKVENCQITRFCLNCGDVKASYNKADFDELEERLNKSLNKFQGMGGGVEFQVLVDSTGRGCVLSHSDKTNHPLTDQIIKQLNKLKWNPAVTANKKEGVTSINMLFSVKESTVFSRKVYQLSGKIDSIDMVAFKKRFDQPTSPEIQNKNYVYQNENLKNYKITVWNSSNSSLPGNKDDNITIDKNGVVWLTAGDYLVTFDGKEFVKVGQHILGSNYKGSYGAIEVDNSDIKWVYGGKNIYSYDDKTVIKYDPEVIGIDFAREIINNPGTGEVFFCSDKGLTIYKDSKWSKINQDKVKELPSNTVAFAKRDSQNRLWIGTSNGSVMIDELGKVTSFNDTETPLKGKEITSMDEDEEGNLFFSLYASGIVIRNVDGSIKQFTISNSGIPVNHVNKVLYDRNEKVLWMTGYTSGLVRYDLKDDWENYHNENSIIPTSYISSMIFDKTGSLYLATRQGLVKIER